MTVCAISSAVRSQQRKPAQLMDFCDICYKPAGCGMAPGTIRSYGALMHISMAINAISLCFTEYEGWMTESAVSLCMLPGEGQLCRIVIKRIDRFIKLPSLRTVADSAAQAEIISMRMTCLVPQKEEEAAD